MKQDTTRILAVVLATLIVSGTVLTFYLEYGPPRTEGSKNSGTLGTSTNSVSTSLGQKVSTSGVTSVGIQHFSRDILIPTSNSSLLHDASYASIDVNQSMVGDALVARWNSALLFWPDQHGTGQTMIVSLKEAGTTLINKSEATELTLAYVFTHCNSNRVIKIIYEKNGTLTDFYPSIATLQKDQVNLGTEAALHPELKYLRVFDNFLSSQEYGCYSEYTAGTFNEASVGWTYVFTHPGRYMVSYRLTGETFRQAGGLFSPVLHLMTLTSLLHNGKTLSENISSLDSSDVARGGWMNGFMGMRIDQQYILFPHGSGNLTFRVSWNATGSVGLQIVEFNLNGSQVSSFSGPTGKGGAMTIEATSGSYWFVFFVDDRDFFQGGTIHFDVEYPGNVNAVTYFEQATKYVH